MPDKRKSAAIAAAAAVAIGGGGAAVAGATGVGDDDASDKPITGSALEQAKSAALEHTGGGRVTETEVGDEEGYYEVEVVRPDGGQVDVHLSEDFKVIGADGDGDGSEDDGAGDD